MIKCKYCDNLFPYKYGKKYCCAECRNKAAKEANKEANKQYLKVYYQTTLKEKRKKDVFCRECGCLLSNRHFKTCTVCLFDKVRDGMKNPSADTIKAYQALLSRGYNDEQIIRVINNESQNKLQHLP